MSRVETDLNEQLPTECEKPLHIARRIQGYGNLNESELDSVVCLVTKILPEIYNDAIARDKDYGLELTMNQEYKSYININLLNMLSQNPIQI